MAGFSALRNHGSPALCTMTLGNWYGSGHKGGNDVMCGIGETLVDREDWTGKWRVRWVFTRLHSMCSAFANVCGKCHNMQESEEAVFRFKPPQDPFCNPPRNSACDNHAPGTRHLLNTEGSLCDTEGTLCDTGKHLPDTRHTEGAPCALCVCRGQFSPAGPEGTTTGSSARWSDLG